MSCLFCSVPSPKISIIALILSASLNTVVITSKEGKDDKSRAVFKKAVLSSIIKVNEILITNKKSRTPEEQE